MSGFNRSFKLAMCATAIAAVLPFAASYGQQAATPKVDQVPTTPLPPPPDMPPLTPQQILDRQVRGAAARGSQAAPNYNVSRRSDFDKALQNPYAANETWYEMPKGRFLGGISGIQVDNDGKSIWVAERCGGTGNCWGSDVDPIIKFSADGKILRMFGKGLISYPHGLWIDADNNVWVTDTQSNVMSTAGGPTPPKPAIPAGAQVLKFSPEGKLLLRLGTPGIYGNDEAHLSQPSDVVTDRQGNIYVADAHDSPPVNNRIVKYDRSGKFIKAWDSCHPSYARQIDCSHSIEMDSQGRIFVANRANNQIDIFDQDGKRLAVWPHFGKPTGLYIDKRTDTLYVADSQSSLASGFQKGTHIGSARTGIVTAFIPDPLGISAPWTGASTLSPEGVTADAQGNVFTASVRPQGITRWSIRTTTRPFPAPAGRGGRGGDGGE
jgi:DNA-binding beta-propeller fold protein YncE